MNLAPRKRLSAVLLALLSFMPWSVSAGMSPEEVKVFESDRVLALSGDPVGQCNLGLNYKRGIGVQQDIAEGVRWYRKAADQGLATAQFNLGCSYSDGEGVAKDLIEAARWYRRAADQGFSKAQNNLGLCYHKGEGVAKDYGEALKWYRKAAEQGDDAGLCNVGDCYRTGEGVAKDDIEAYAYLNLAGITNDLARAKRQIIEKNLSPEAQLKGQQRTKELQKEIEAKIATNKTEDEKKPGK